MSLVVVLTLAAVTVLISGEPTLTRAVLGLAFGVGFVLVSGAGRGQAVPIASLPRRGLYLLVYLLVVIPAMIVRANVVLASRVARRRPAIAPGIVGRPVDRASPFRVALEQHALTVTPGQMLVEDPAGEDRCYVHVIDVRDVTREERPLERLTRHVLRGFME